VYLGGHIHVVSEAAAAELVAAGFGQYLDIEEPLPGDGDIYRGGTPSSTGTDIYSGGTPGDPGSDIYSGGTPWSS